MKQLKLFEDKMKVGFLGLGKLGLPCALAVERIGGHEVYGYDVSPDVVSYIRDRKLPYKEIYAQEWLEESDLHLVEDISQLVENSDIILVPIQTPHRHEFEGTTPLTEKRADFEYAFLVEGIRSLAKEAFDKQKHVVVNVISTVLPGTIDREIRPLLNEFIHLCYNPFFIAMGTTIRDFVNPEFVLLGVDEEEAAKTVTDFYATIHDRPVFKTDIKTAELVKVGYNTFIGMKIAYINTMMEICHKTGANVDDFSDAIALATERLISPKYLRAGMGDGGGCHPRDNIAMSWVAHKLGLSHDIFTDIMEAREDQTKWLAKLMLSEYKVRPRNLVILGESFKAETNLTVGSPSVLLYNILCYEAKYSVTHPVTIWDPYTQPESSLKRDVFAEPSIYLIGTNHSVFKMTKFPYGSTVLDPWGIIKDQPGVNVVRIGRK